MATAPSSTQIIAPRVELIDTRTGLIHREWYRFLYNLYEVTGSGDGIIPVSRGGTGVTVTPTNGQILIGNGTGYTVSGINGATGITVVNGAGAISLFNDGVITFSTGTTGLTPSTPTAGGVTLGGVLNVANGGTGNSTAPTDGQLLIGNGTGYTIANLTAGTAISITDSAGGIQIDNDGVTSFTGGTTGLTPSIATTGAVTLAGTLNIANGGTGATDAAGARANLSAAVLGANDDITSLIGLTGEIETPTYIQMETSPTVTMAKGKLAWNATDETLDIGMDYNVVQQVGQEVYARVGNTTGVTIPNGAVVGFAGATTDALLVAPYLADGTSPSLYILGVMTHDLPDSGDKGYCCTWGFVRGVDTSAFGVGDILYASPTVAGELVNTKPTAPDNVIPLAACLVSDATDGIIFVRPTIQQMQYYGVFAKTTDQSPIAINTEYLLTFDSTTISNGVTIGTPASRIVVPESGLYNFTANVQVSSGSSSAKNVWFWFKKNGTAIANSARIVTSDINNGYIPITLNEPVSLAANDYVEIAFAADSTSVTVDNVAATAFAPAAPAIVLSVTQVQQ